jgi:4a-hydroxytetrahydrobiopterin dehydratase
MSGTTYGETAIEARLRADLPGWSYTDGHLTRTFKTGNWVNTQLLFNAIGYLAERADHHPDMTASYGTLAIKIMTHSAGGITDKDFNLASKITALTE